MAAGFSIKNENISKLYDFFDSLLLKDIKDIQNNNARKVDLLLSVDMLTIELYYDIQKLAPFGPKNQTPVIVLNNVLISKIEIMKSEHLRCYIASVIHGVKGKFIKALAWRSVDTALGDAIIKAAETKEIVSILGTIQLNVWNSRETVQFVIDDIMFDRSYLL